MEGASALRGQRGGRGDSDSAGLTRHRVCVLGGGSFGSAIARIVASSVAAKPAEFASEVRQWVRREALALEINTAHTNAQYLPGATFGANLVATTDAAAAVADAAGCRSCGPVRPSRAPVVGPRTPR